MRSFTLVALLAFGAVALTLYVLQQGEEDFFAQVQDEQAAFFAQAQAELALQQVEAARASLMAVHEAGHLNLARLMANTMWDSDVGPLVAAAQRIAVDRCRTLPAADRRDCFAEAGARIQQLPGFRALDAKAYRAMRATTVFKVKIFDLRGLTVYSSEQRQIGEDAAENRGWQAAAHGEAVSELTHRDRFSAFERVVENRDLISTYVPVRAAGGAVVGVFEIYSDVTPFLDQIKAAAQRFTEISAGNDARIARAAAANRAKVSHSSDEFLAIVLGLLALLLAVSLAIVQVGQRIIDRQRLAQAQAARREQQWHREKMAALSAMAANVSHEVGNPLAVISGLVEDLAAQRPDDALVGNHSRLMLEHAARIATMTRQISDFAAARSESAEWVDVNAMVKAVCDFLGFEQDFRATPIEFRAAPGLPARKLVPDHLNEVLMSVLQAWVGSVPAAARSARLRVETALQGDDLLIRIGDDAPPVHPSVPAGIAHVLHDARFEAARRRVQGMGGRLSAAQGRVEIALPAGA